jgi:hypothetical protein
LPLLFNFALEYAIRKTAIEWNTSADDVNVLDENHKYHKEKSRNSVRC